MVSKRKFGNISCKDYALFLVSIKSQSIGQLRQKLERKGYENAEIDATILRLSELGYLNDDQFAQNYFDNLIKYKNFGYFGIKKKLLEKKLPQKEVEKIMRSLSLKDELAIARRLMEKSKSKSKEQLVRSLQSKGFRLDVIFKATKVQLEE